MLIRLSVCSVIIQLMTFSAYGEGFPHFLQNEIECESCHYVHGDQPKLLPPWTVHVSQNIDDTQFNSLCWSCHNDIDAVFVETHSSLQTDNDYGDWTIECVVCHDPHFQVQAYTYTNPSDYIYQGVSAAVDATTITGNGVNWTVDKFKGNIVIPNKNEIYTSYKIVGNSADTLTVDPDVTTPAVDGSMDLGLVSAGDTFAVSYSKLIRSPIDLGRITADPAYPKSGTKTVKFSRREGVNSFADGNDTYDGICEICHENTSHFRNNVEGDDPLHTNMGSPAGTNCIICHLHENGFMGMGSGVHKPHVTVLYGPQLDCYDCHETGNIPYFKSGTDGNGDGKYSLAETDVCDFCHSTDGVARARTYWSDAPGTWVSTEGEQSFCGSCHDVTPGNSSQDGTGNDASDIMGDNTTYGYFVTGHGKNSGTYQRLSWQEAAASGNPAANQSCDGCHDLTSLHFNNITKRLKSGFENDIANSNCRQCHDPGTVAAGNPAWYTTYTAYQNSAHKDEKCSNCHDVHGLSGANPAMTTANQETLCYQCHTEGAVMNNAISGSVDDIEQAFGQAEKHNLGSSFSVGGNDYSLECISCHNVHLITGKHWDAEQGVSPVTRFTDNLKVWGDEPGEKTDDFAAGASGSGGFYYKTAQGYSLGDTGLPFDQPARYQPPQKTSGYDLEFGGDVLPDYTTFCLDCHSSRMANDVGAINWGQGISGGFPDPPGPGYSNWVNTSAPHGLHSADMPSYVTDSGTPGNWGAGGNPDVLFDMNYVTRGRHTGHFMRWPYDSADRSAGINFVMACTDCHEAHGSSVNSMLRTTVNTGTGSGSWNTMCNNCHYYYGGQHAGMSCATSSCHEGYSIHRIKKNGGGGPTQLMLTASGSEGSYIRPDFTPEIETVAGHIGSNELTVTFRESQHGGTSGLYGKSNLTGALDKDNFWLFDKGSNNPRTITNVTHIAGEMTATLTMNAPLVEADLSTDTLAMKPASAWGWYVGGYVNAATGTLPAEAVSAGPWPVNVTGPSDFNVQSFLYGRLELKVNGIVVDSNQMYVTFAEGAYANSGATGDLLAVDFALVCGGRTISSVAHTAGDTFAILTLDSLVGQSEIGVCTVAAESDSIFDSYGNPAGTGAVTLTLPPEASVTDLVLRWNFNEASGVAQSAGALGTQEDMHGVLTRNVVRVASTKPSTAAGDKVIKLDRVSDSGAVQLNYTVNPNDGFPPATYNSGGVAVIVQEMQQTSEFSFSVWIKPTVLGCSEGQILGLNTKLRRDVLTTQLWIKNWAIGIMRFSDDGDPVNGDCTTEDATHDVLRFWVAVGDPADMRCDAWGGSWPEYVHPVSPAGYTQGTTLMPTDQAVCDNSATPILPTNTQAHSFAQTETSASGAPTYGGVALQPGVWQHVVGTWDGRYIRIYINGQLGAETDMGGTGNYVMVADPHLWGGDLIGDGSLTRHVSSFFAAGARPIFSSTGSPSAGAVYWNTNGFYDLNSSTFVGELDDVKYWKIALPPTTIQN